MSKRGTKKIHHSAGGIIYRNAENLEFLVVKQIRWTGEIQWVSPKGHLEAGEEAVDAAIREVTEEIGLKQLRNISYIGDQRYIYMEKGKENEKIVSWYVMEAVGDEELNLNKSEGFVDARWLQFEAARSQFTHQSFGAWLDLAFSTITAGFSNWKL